MNYLCISFLILMFTWTVVTAPPGKPEGGNQVCRNPQIPQIPQDQLDRNRTGAECGCQKDSKTSNFAMKAAQEAKEAQEAQQLAGAQAAHQVKCQLAEKANQAAKAAEAALLGKQALVDQLEHEVREAQAVVQEEASSCQQSQTNLQISLTAAAQAVHLLRALTGTVQIAQANLANTQQAAEGAQKELGEKTALVEAAKARVDGLLRELCAARQELTAIKQATYKAQAAARNAETTAQRNRRRLQCAVRHIDPVTLVRNKSQRFKRVVRRKRNRWDRRKRKDNKVRKYKRAP